MIITLCGSSRFEPWFKMWKLALGIAGHPTFDISSYPSEHDGAREWYSPEVKAALDDLHFSKIVASKVVVFLNVMAYMGMSTLKEFEYAQKLDKQIVFLESWGEGYGIYGAHKDYLHAAVKKYAVPTGFGSPIDTSKHIDIWSSNLLGPAGGLRNSIVKMVREREALAFGVSEEERR